MPEELTSQPEPGGMARVAQSTTGFEAEAKAAILREAGIDAVVFKGNEVWFGADRNRADQEAGFGVLVHSDELDEAQRVLEDATNEAKRIDWDHVDLGDPAQTSRTTDKHHRPLTLVLVIAGIMLVGWLILKLAGVL